MEKKIVLLESVGYLLYYILSNLIPPQLNPFLASFVAYVVKNVQKKDFYQRMRIISKIKKIPAIEARSIVFRTLYNFNLGLIEFFQSGRINRKNFEEFFIIKNLNLLKVSLTKGSVILVSLHMGNWEMGGIALGVLGYPVWGLIWPPRSRIVGWLFQRIRKKKGVNAVENVHIKQVIGLLRKNIILGIMLDTGRGMNNVLYPYKDLIVKLSRGPFLLAEKTGAEILMVYSLKDKDGKYMVEFKSIRRKRSLEETIIKAFEELVKVAEEHIDQWHWIIDFF